ncbi:hypothetical protein HDV02_002325 [Globomyces sp. JEL0801]|nr:hypothetical protein HDV02_002325 [Globomyces sp. JEL0801]
MGKGRDKKKKSQKSKTKETKKELDFDDEKLSKSNKKQKKRIHDDEEEDIDAILNEFNKHQSELFKITEESNCGVPSRRANASWTLNPLNNAEFLLFGGEYYDGQKVFMYNDLFKFNIEKSEWKRITSPNSPAPRSSHQIAITPAGLLFLWGGEFVSPNETSFFHYKDFWMMDLKTNAWEKLDIRGRPPPRSGHRMVVWKHFIVMFGGFYDQNKETKYYDDLWLFDTQEFKWIKVEVGDPKPAARSGFQLLVHGDQICLYGGYCKVALKGKKLQGMVHTDTWTLYMSLDPKNIRWERKKKSKGSLPIARSGCTTVYHKGKGIMFGGVSDIQEDDESLESIVHADLYQYQIDANKWYPISLKKPKQPKKKKAQKSECYGSDDNESEDEKADEDEVIGPTERYNAMMGVSKNILYLFGGIVEKENKEMTLNDLWSLNLDKLDKWNHLIVDERVNELVGEDSEDDDDEDDEDDDDEENDDDDDGEGSDDDGSEANVEEQTSRLSLNESKTNASEEESKPEVVLTEEERLEQAANDPLPGESVSDYYARTSEYWQKIILIEAPKSGKQLRRNAFDRAYKRFHTMLPENKILEEQMRENEALEQLNIAKMKEKADKDKTIAALVLKIDPNSLQVVVEHYLQNVTLEDIVEELPETSPRFIVISYELKHKDGRISYPLAGSSLNNRMCYASTVTQVFTEAGITGKVFDLVEAEELTDDWMVSQLESSKTRP